MRGILKILIGLAILGIHLGASEFAFSEPDRGNVLILGDSHLFGEFGKSLQQLISVRLGMATLSIAVCAGSPELFLSAKLQGPCGLKVRRAKPYGEIELVESGRDGVMDSLITTLSSLKPRLTVINLGTNMNLHSNRAIGVSANRLVQTITSILPDTVIVWVGPPAYNGSERIRSALTASLGPLHGVGFLDGSLFTRDEPLPRKNPHFGSYKASQWAGYVFDGILNYLSHLPRENSREVSRNDGVRESFHN